MESTLIKDLSNSVIPWIEKNYPDIQRIALLTAGKVKWGGRFKSDRKVPTGTAVMYQGKVFLCISDKQDNPPTEKGVGFIFLADVKGSKVREQPFNFKSITVPPNLSSREGVISSRIAQYAVNKLTAKIQASSMKDVYTWRGLFQSGDEYAKKDIVVYAGKLFTATTGNGSPHSSGWEELK